MIFKRFFTQKQQKTGTADIHLQVDIHSHLIPGIDDGSQSIAESLDILRAFEQKGFKKVITTPHIMGDFYKNTPEIILGGLSQLKSAMSAEKLSIRLEAAAEYYLDEFFLKDLKEEKQFMTFGKNYLLFELPYINAPIHMDEAIFLMQSQGYKPVLAHPERYQFYHGKSEKIKELKAKGVLLQLNTNSLTGYYSKPAKKMAEKLLKDNQIDFLGSDVHNMKHFHSMADCLSGKWAKVLASKHFLNNSLLNA